MPDRVGDADTPRTGFDRGRVEPPQMLRFRPRRVLGHEHHRQTLADDIADGLVDERQHSVQIPVLGVLPNRARADEAGGFDDQPGRLGDLDDRLEIPHNRPCGTVGEDR